MNPSHLFVGTGAENTADKIAKGRQVHGSAIAQASLDEPTVLRLRETYAAGGVSQERIARMFGIQQTTVSMIVRGVTWRDVSTEEIDVAMIAAANRWRVLSPEAAARIVEMRIAGIRNSELAHLFGVSPRRIRQIAGRNR